MRCGPRVVRRARVVVPALLLGLAACGGGGRRSGPTPATGGHVATTVTVPTTTTALFPLQGTGPSYTAPGSDPSVLPGPVLIADEGNNRLVIVDPEGRTLWTFPDPGDLPPGVELRSPDDAFFTPDGRQIIVTEEEYSVISLVDIATRRIVWRYGTPGVPGSAVEHLSNPDDAIVLPNHDVLLADIKNCRLLLLAPGATEPSRIYGTTTQACRHAPPLHFGSPNGAFPMDDGHFLVTEINGDWVDEMNLTGTIYWSAHPPGISYPSDSNEIRPGVYLTVDYSDPGQIVTFTRDGQLLWRYRPIGAQSLSHPSLALPLPDGDVIATDDANDRVIVVDPRTGRLVWQYGTRRVAGASPGLLNGPDGLDLAPPFSDLVRHLSTMGTP